MGHSDQVIHARPERPIDEFEANPTQRLPRFFVERPEEREREPGQPEEQIPSE